MPKAFLIDTTRCTACRGCQLACKEWHNLPANVTKQRGSHQNPPDLNPYNLKIVRFHEHLDDAGNVVWNFFPDQCRHCLNMLRNWKQEFLKNASSVFSQKESKAAKRAEQKKEVALEKEKTKMLTKCDMCIDRVSAGLQPMCVKTCPTGAMVFGEREEVLAEGEKRLARIKERYPKARLVDTEDVSVFYLLAEEPKHYHEFASFG